MQVDDHNRPDNHKKMRSGTPFWRRMVNRWPGLRELALFEEASKGMRGRILVAVILIGMLFSGLAAVPAVLLAVREGLWILLFLDLVVFVSGLFLIFSKRLTARARAWAASALIYGVGIYVIVCFGFLSGGPIWLFSFPVIVGLLLGVRPAIAGLCINGVTLVALAFLHSATPLGDKLPFFTTILNALAAGGNFLFLNTLVAISCALLIENEKQTSLFLSHEKSQIQEAKRSLEEEIIFRKEAETKQRELAQELEFLRATAMAFVAVSDEDSLYRFIGERVREILGDVVVVVNSFDPKTREFRAMAVEGLGATAERLLNTLGRSPIGLVTTLNDDVAEATLKTGKLAEGPKGIYELSFGAIPKTIAASLDRLLGIRQIYVIGLVREGDLFGSAVIVDRNRSTDAMQKNRGIVEAFMNQASLALLRNRFEKELKESEERYRQLFNNAPAGIFEIDFRQFGITSVNDIMCDYTGYSREEFLALDPLRLIAEEGLEHFVGRGRDLSVGEVVPESTEYKIRRKDGGMFWARCHSRATWENGSPVKTTIVTHDITKVKTLEEEKQKLQESLLEARKMEAIATLAGGVAHQFNNALSVVSVSMDMLEMCWEEGPDCKKYIGMVRDSVERMTGLTGQLLAYARGGRYYSRTMSLSQFTAETLSDLLPEIPDSIQVKTDLSDDVLPVRFDPKQMKSVLFAILTNAVEASDENGKISITCENQTIEETDVKQYPGLAPGPFVALTIEDNGKGMDPQTLRKVFDPFFTTKFQGRGLGMPAVLGIVRNHGGWIGVSSEIGQGTIVRILLPVSEEKAEG